MFKIFAFIILFQFQLALADQRYVNQDTLIAVDSARSYTLNINSNLDNAKIYLDTSLIGVTPLLNYKVIEGKYEIKIFNPKSLKDWESENEAINIYINKDTTLRVDFSFFYYFNSTPFDAEVFENDSLLGRTPLRFFKDYELTGNLLLKKKNYKDYIYDLKNYDFEKGADILLQSKGTETVNDLVYKNRATQFKTKRSLITIGALAAATLAGGFFSVNYKNKANKDYDNYRSTGNTASLDNSRSNDTYFVISLVLMQAAIGGLIYFLFFDK